MGNFIEISDKYAISSDSNQWTLQKKVKPSKSNPEGWVSFNYYSTLDTAAKGLADRMIRESNETSVNGLSRAATDIVNMLREKFTQLNIEVK